MNVPLLFSNPRVKTTVHSGFYQNLGEIMFLTFIAHMHHPDNQSLSLLLEVGSGRCQVSNSSLQAAQPGPPILPNSAVPQISEKGGVIIHESSHTRSLQKCIGSLGLIKA